MDKTPHKHLPKLTALLLLVVAVLVVRDGVIAYFDKDAAAARICEDAFHSIQSHHLKPVERATLLHSALKAMVASLKDPHSEFLPPCQHKAVEEEQSGEFVGVGIQVNPSDKQLVVVAPIEGSPAHRAGILPEDIIVEVDGTPCQGLAKGEILSKIRGPKGSKVTLTIQRPGHDGLLAFTLTRERIEMPNVEGRMLVDKIGLLRITSFSAKTSDKVAKEIRKLRIKQLAALVLDLRSNPGGFLDEAVAVADLFLDEGVIVTVQGRHQRENKVYSAKKDGTLPPFPVAILVDRGTASASEVLTAALQENGRAKVVGTRTFGKGVVNRDFPLADGSGLILTVAEYLTPKGRMIERTGIEPDIKFEAAPGARTEGERPRDLQLDEAMKWLRNTLDAR